MYPVKKLVPLTADLAERVSEYRHTNRISSENEAIRQLIEAGLQARKSSAPSGGSDPGGDKPCSGDADNAAPSSQPSASDRTPKAAPLIKEAQLRAMREHGAR